MSKIDKIEKELKEFHKQLLAEYNDCSNVVVDVESYLSY